jgi:hypothetical protein
MIKTARKQIILAAIGCCLSLVPATKAQFAYTNNDLALGFRKTGIHQESYEVVVDIGSAPDYVNLQVGSTINVPNFTAAQLVPDSFANFNYLNWSVTGFARTNTLFVLPGYVNNTLWLTVPRVSQNTQSTPPARLNYTSQGSVATQMKSILSGAAYISTQTAAGADNAAKFIREPVNNSANLSAFIASVVDSSGSTLRDSWPMNVETTTQASFSGNLVADFYEVRPTVDPQGNPITDPHTGQTTGDAYYVGYFTLNSVGTMTFTRGSGTAPPPPTAPALSVARSASTTTVSFTSQNGVSYTLYYTDASGLNKPISNWSSVANKITGDGSTKGFQDTTTDVFRFYRVGAL